MTLRRCLLTSLILFVLCCLVCPVRAASIEADPNADYSLTKNRGPWMIMVATFHTTGEDGTTDQGKTPQQAASELVLELRRLGMPAYTFEHDPAQQFTTVTDRLGREERRKNLRRIKSVCVLAGNYHDINDDIAQKSLDWVKALQPRCLEEGVTYVPTKGRKTPLMGAFLTVNPMLTPEELKSIQESRVDPLLVRLNHGERYSLTENSGKYTLIIARFYGKHVTVKPGSELPGISDFLKSNALDDAALSARELVTVLRGNYDREATNFNNIDAYIWHDHHESVVTVGSFTSPDDPAIAHYVKKFGPKMKVIDAQGTTNFQAEHLGVSGFGPNKDQNRLWLFEPEPAIMRVPKLR